MVLRWNRFFKSRNWRHLRGKVIWKFFKGTWLSLTLGPGSILHLEIQSSMLELAAPYQDHDWREENIDTLQMQIHWIRLEQNQETTILLFALVTYWEIRESPKVWTSFLDLPNDMALSSIGLPVWDQKCIFFFFFFFCWAVISWS